MSNGGANAQRGFIFQSIIAMIECLERDDWDEIKMEPETKLDKVDFVLSRNGSILSAEQVKSRQSAFGDKDVKEWLEELKRDAPGAEEYCLCLVGQCRFLHRKTLNLRQVSRKIGSFLCPVCL